MRRIAPNAERGDKMPLIYISPSGQSYNKYAWAGTNEAVQMRKIALKMESILRTYGCQTVIPGEILTMEQRIEQANNLNADCYISLHSSASAQSGSECFYAPEKSGSQSLAEQLCAQAQSVSGRKGGGARDGMQAYGGLGYAELRLVRKCPVLIRIESHDTPDLAKWICEHTSDIASALCTGILRYVSSITNAITEKNTEQPNQAQNYYHLYIQYGVFLDAESANKASDLIGSLGFKRFIFYGK